KTNEPTRTRSVRAASHVVVTIASYIGWSSAMGGARWSMPVIPTKPAASAACARATSLSNDIRICGRNRLNSIRGRRRDARAAGRAPTAAVVPRCLADRAAASCRRRSWRDAVARDRLGRRLAAEQRALQRVQQHVADLARVDELVEAE